MELNSDMTLRSGLNRPQGPFDEVLALFSAGWTNSIDADDIIAEDCNLSQHFCTGYSIAIAEQAV
jgi:hypothetical protein